MNASAYNIYSVTDHALRISACCVYEFKATIEEYHADTIKGAWHSLTWSEQEELAEVTGNPLDYNDYDECYILPTWFDLALILKHDLFNHRELHAIEHAMFRYFGK